NVVILTALYVFRFSRALALVVLKCVVLMFLTGSAAAFLYSLSGSLLSFFVMGLLIRLSETAGKARPVGGAGKISPADGTGPVSPVGPVGPVSPVGVSAVGAVFHNVGQILIAALMLRSFNIVLYLPVLIFSGVLTGLLVGVAVNAILPVAKRLQKSP
ncbi:MAG: Gx transporter family protein, partial [Clostridiales bacterium]|nr:Gx transporter family protein [Clostridiales bacterium]